MENQRPSLYRIEPITSGISSFRIGIRKRFATDDEAGEAMEKIRKANGMLRVRWRKTGGIGRTVPNREVIIDNLFDTFEEAENVMKTLPLDI